jgi:hypothetical protein
MQDPALTELLDAYLGDAGPRRAERVVDLELAPGRDVREVIKGPGSNMFDRKYIEPGLAWSR